MDAVIQTAEDVPIYRIQTVSALTGISARRIRRWDGLVHARRTKGGHRFYSTRDVKLLREIRRFVEGEGMSLQAVKSWLEAHSV
jgi:MerR family transcriptional regulator/heat shock protein HspR